MGMPSTSRYGVAFGDSRRGHNNNTNNTNPDVIERFFSGWENVFCAPHSMETYSKETVEEPDVLDYVFEHVESFTCAEESSYQNDPFFTPPRGHHHHHHPQPYGLEMEDANSFDLSLKRENSLVEQGPNGAPAYMATTRKQQPSLVAKLGQEGDLLDYCFEHVESFVCHTDGDANRGEYYYDENDGRYYAIATTSKGGKSSRTPMRNTTNNQNQRRNRSSPESSHPIPRVISTPRNTKNKKKKRRDRRKQNYFPDEEDNILLYYRPMKATH